VKQGLIFTGQLQGMRAEVHSLISGGKAAHLSLDGLVQSNLVMPGPIELFAGHRGRIF